MATLRSSAKTSRLATALHQLRAGASARTLPPIVQSLSVRSEGVKGNAAARKWAKTVLPALSFANPGVKVELEKNPVGDKAKEQGDEPWTQPPGVTVTFNDSSLPHTFFPLSSTQRSDKLVSRFWSVFGEERTLRAFAEGQEVEQPAPAVEEPAAAEGQQQEPEAATAAGAGGATVAA
ncbi:hypothetical protein JCM11251_000473 [Rhodosporidiobolus azoricus]